MSDPTVEGGENQNAVEQSKNIQSAFSSKAARKTSGGTTAPFNACLATLSTMALALQIAALLGSFLGSYLALFVACFSFEWINVHFPSMTRTRRACFDVANVLETYQPRARTHGHLFIPDPPTPAVTIAAGTENHEMPKEKTDFMNARDSHYENMYEKALKMAKEMEQNEKKAGSPSMDVGKDNVELKPANPEEDKKANDEKSKKAKEKYDADMQKPFSC